ncbi:MAG: hypothetical protein K8W52_32130 [Deltaproteobacteria bacterium]|nr:hypothetical protein [Deltaproteobacteria bacterium]
MRVIGFAIALALAAQAAHAANGAPAGRGAKSVAADLADVTASEAAVVVRADVDGLSALADVAISRGNILERTALVAARAQLAELTGGDLAARSGWTALGLDPDRPLLISIAPIAHGPGTSWRVNLRVPVADRRRVQRAVTRFERWVGATVVTFDRGTPPELAGRRVTSFHLPRAFGFIRLDARSLAIDIVPQAGIDQSAASLARAIIARSAPAAIDALLASDAGAALAASGVDVFIDPQAFARTSLLTRGWPADRVEGPCNLTCVVLRGPLGPLGVSLGTRGATITVDARWQVEAGSPLAAVLAATVDHGLPRPADLPDAALIVRSYVAGWGRLATLDTSAVPLDLPPPVFASSASAWPVTALWSWPVLIGGVVAHVTAAEPTAAPLLSGVGDFAIAVLALGDDVDHTSALAELAIDPTTTSTLHGFADRIWGPARDAIWGTGRVRGFARTIGGSTPTVGFALRDTATRWLPVARSSQPPPAGTVAEGRIAVDVLTLVDPMAHYLGNLSFAARFDGALRVDLAFDPP